MGMEIAKGDQSSPEHTTTYTGKANRKVLILDCQTRLPVTQNKLNWCEVAVPTNKWLVSLLEDDPKLELTTSPQV